MEHPFINDLEDLSIDALSAKITELQRKLRIATSFGNGHLCDQIRMALDSYQTKYQQKLDELLKKDQKAVDAYNSKIDIS
jgi:hypothetical protein